MSPGVEWPDLSAYIREPVTAGPWRLAPWVASDSEVRAARLYDAAHGGRDRANQLVVGKQYTQLWYRGDVMMSDTPMELETNAVAVARATGDVLIGGLGLGLVALAIRRKPAVRTVTVVEIDPVLISLMRQYVPPLQDRITIIPGDIWDYRPGRTRYDTIYIDVWLNRPNLEDKAEMAKLRARYRRYLRPRGWVGCWAEREVSRW